MKWFQVTIEGESCKVCADDESEAIAKGKEQLGKDYAKSPAVCPCEGPEPKGALPPEPAPEPPKKSKKPKGKK